MLDPAAIPREATIHAACRSVPARDVVLPVLDLLPAWRVVRRRAPAAVISAGDLVPAQDPAPSRARPPRRFSPVVTPVPPPVRLERPPLWARRLRAAAADGRVRMVVLAAILLVLSVHMIGQRVAPAPRAIIEAPSPVPGHEVVLVHR